MNASSDTISVTRREVVFLAAGLAIALFAANALRSAPAAAITVPDATFVPIDNCRLFDTRPDPQFNIGDRNTPIGPDEVHQQQVTGAVGDCNIPPHAVGVSLNVTAVEPTAASFLTVFPYAPDFKVSSNLNYQAGSPPTPNKVDVKLSSAGQLGFYNFAGTVHVVTDVSGYYTRQGLDTMNATIGDLADDVAALQAADAELEAADAELADDIAALRTDTNANHVFTAAVSSTGTKLAPGPYTPQLGGLVGTYIVTFKVLSRQISRSSFVQSRVPIVFAATPDSGCVASASIASFTIDPSNPDVSILDTVIVTVQTNDRITDVLAGCDFNLALVVSDPNSINLGL